MSFTILTTTRYYHDLGKPIPLDIKSRDKGKQRVLNLSFNDSRNAIPAAQRDSDSYSLSLPPSGENSDVTPTAASVKSPPRPPIRSPYRHSQSGSPRRRDQVLSPEEPLPVLATDNDLPIPRQGKADSESAKARRREAYKSGMSFVSLYELYTEPPPLPVPPVPPLDRANLPSTTGSASASAGAGRSTSRSRSGSNAGRERKISSHGLASVSTSSTTTATAPTNGNGHIRGGSGSTDASPRRSPPLRGAEQSGSLGLANATISSSVNVATAPLNATGAVEVQATRSKRQHILFEILDTERIYSSDMALVKAVHLPLALGLKIDFGPMGSTQASARSSTDPTADPNGPSRSSGISTNTVSSSQSQSGSSGYPLTPGFVPLAEPPMSVEDAKVIFANLDELAEFTGRFTEFIQLALGSEIEGGLGPDKIGGLFLEMVSSIGVLLWHSIFDLMHA